MSLSRSTLLKAAALLVLPVATGCSTFTGSSGQGSGSMFDRIPWFSQKEKPPEPYPNPVKMVATWTPDTLLQTGRTPTRGFGGRIYFYNEKSQAVPVDGTLMIHGFDEFAPEGEEKVKKFAFTPEQFTRHFSQSDLGASYSVWLPWDAVGGDQKKISLVPTFTTETGKTVQGVPTTVLLPGRTPPPEEQLADKLSPDFRRWQQASAGETNRPSGLTTTTIPRAAKTRLTSPLAPEGSAAGRSMMAGGSGTPSAEVRISKRPNRPEATTSSGPSAAAEPSATAEPSPEPSPASSPTMMR